MSISYFTESFARTIGAESRNFHVLIDGNSGTKQQIYEFVQYSLRQASDIDSGGSFTSVTGSVAEELLEFVGDTLKTKFQSTVGGNAAVSGGVFIDNFLAIDTNTITFVDDLNIERTFPFVLQLQYYLMLTYRTIVMQYINYSLQTMMQEIIQEEILEHRTQLL